MRDPADGTNSTQADDRLLDGVRVLDLSRVMSGPFCTAMLADLGAEVIKIEMPGSGEDSRHFGPFRDGESAYFMMLNRGKKSVTLNLKSEAGLGILRELAMSSDVLVENFRPGVTERLGLDYSSLQSSNPRLVYSSITGFGRTGPLAGRPAYDPVVQAMSGLMDLTGQADGPPTAVGESVADICSGMFAAWGITTALFARERDGKGRHIDVAMLDSVFSMMLTALSLALYTDRAPARVGNRHPVTYPVDTFRARNGHVVIVVTSDRAFGALGKVIGQPSLAADRRFRSNADRNAHETELREIIESWTSQRGLDDIVGAMDAAGIPAAPVLSLGEVLKSAHIAFRGMVSTVEHPDRGSMPLVRQPVRFSGAAHDFSGPPPLLGEHTREVLTSLLGLRDADIERLSEQDVI